MRTCCCGGSPSPLAVNITPSSSRSWFVAAATALSFAPGSALVSEDARGALIGTVLNADQFTLFNLCVSPILALAAGVLFGITTGDSGWEKVVHSVVWTVGAFGLSMGLQFVGCNAVNARFGG